SLKLAAAPATGGSESRAACISHPSPCGVNNRAYRREKECEPPRGSGGPMYDSGTSLGWKLYCAAQRAEMRVVSRHRGADIYQMQFDEATKGESSFRPLEMPGSAFYCQCFLDVTGSGRGRRRITRASKGSVDYVAVW